MKQKSILLIAAAVFLIAAVCISPAAAYEPVNSPVLGTKEITLYNGVNTTITLYDHSKAIDAIFANPDMDIGEKFDAEILQLGWDEKLAAYDNAMIDEETGEPIYEESLIDSILLFFNIIEKPDYYDRASGEKAMTEYLYNYEYNWRGLE